MHKEILTKKQSELLPLINQFASEFTLVGGTAIALQIGHRESIDFDLFSKTEFDNSKIRKLITKSHTIDRTIIDEKDQYTIIVNGVQLTFLRYPFKINSSEYFESIIKMPDLLTLAAMKSYALGRRVKWKDYVDLYFILKNFHSVEEISDRAREIFGNEFNEKAFREQLSYFDDIDYSEKIIYKNNFSVDDKIIKEELIEYSLETVESLHSL